MVYLAPVGTQMSCSLSPVKFAGGDCWPRAPTQARVSSLLSPGGSGSGDQPMEVGVEQMDVSSKATEVSAPLPIKKPSGNTTTGGPFKKQAYPLMSKRPEHLRMNL